MIFQSRWNNAAYIVRPTIRTVHLGVPTLTPGLRAEFTGAQRIFDSEVSQKKYNWTDEERKTVETHLLKHRDFGNGIYLAPGQDLPDEFREVARIKPEDRGIARCAHVEYREGKVVMCDNEAMVGGTKCSTHRDDRVDIVKGLVKSGG